MRHCLSTTTAYLRVFPHYPDTERRASGAANSRSDAGVEAIGGRLQANVRLGCLVGLWVRCSLSGPLPCPYALLLDHLVRLEQERRGYRDPEGLGGLEVDDQLVLHGLLHGQLRGLGALQDLVH
jgi:hypothetical protein